MTTPLIIPTLNNNGSSVDDLIIPRVQASALIDALVNALSAVVPHGRDYLGDDAALQADRQTHRDRISALRTLHTALLDECIAIRNQYNKGE